MKLNANSLKHAVSLPLSHFPLGSSTSVGNSNHSEEQTSADKVWPDVEAYIANAARVLRTGGEESRRCLRDLRHRMHWYTCIYNVCHLNLRNAHTIYNRLAVFLLNDLEVNVLQPLLHNYGNSIPLASATNRADGANPNDSTKTSTSSRLCAEFLRHYEHLLLFRRVVLSCFSYLDRYYVPKFGLDTVTVLCLKMFYVVVYEPIRENLVEELMLFLTEARVEGQQPQAQTRAKNLVRQTISAISDILTTVRAFSISNAGAQVSEPSIAGSGGGGVFERVAEEVTRLQRTRSAFDVGNDGENEEYDSRHSAMDRIRRLRERLERRTVANLMGSGGGHAAAARAAAAELTHPSIVNLFPPRHLLIFADFGIRFGRQAEIFYKDWRALQLTGERRRGYMACVYQTFESEWSLVRDVNEPIFLRAYRELLGQVLLLDVHRLVILDEEIGFRALLDAYLSYSGRDSTALFTTSVGNNNGSFGSSFKGPSSTELAQNLKQFYNAFASQHDEACCVLLASELASKVVVDISSLFLTFLRTDSTKGPSTSPEEKSQASRLSIRQHTTPSVSSVSSPRPVSKQPLQARGPQENTTPSHEQAMALVATLIDAVALYNRLVQNQFAGDQIMHAAVSDAMRAMLNPDRWGYVNGKVPFRGGAVGSDLPSVLLSRDATKRITSPLAQLAAFRDSMDVSMPPVLASYCDQLCRRESTGAVEDHSASDRMDRVAYLVLLIDDKDIFIEQYRLLLARRLLSMPASQLNLEVERMLIHKLQQALGRTVAHSIDAMLRDYENSVNTTEAFAQSDVYPTLPAKLRVQVLTSVHWPVYRVVQLQPCASLSLGMSAFAKYYAITHPSRTLRWIHSLGTATLTAVFPKGLKEIMASTIQATILILVSEACGGKSSPLHGISGESIAAVMGMKFVEVNMHLDFLVQNRAYALLRRCHRSATPTEGALQPGEVVTLNENYTHKLRKFRLPVARPRPSPGLAKGAATLSRLDEESGDVVPKSIDDTRRLQIDAAIIRVMKSHRSMKYYELLEATTQQLSRLFIPNSRVVKAQVEDLVGRGFLRRSETDAAVFEYVA